MKAAAKKASTKNGVVVKMPLEANYDKILRHFRNPERYPLGKELEGILKRYECIHALKKQMKPDKNIVILMCRDFGISKPQAYRDLNEAKRFFPSLIKTDKEYRRLLYLEWVESGLERAQSKNDLRMEAEFLKLYMQGSGLDKEDPDLPNFEEMGERKFVLNVYIANGQRAIPIDLEQQPKEGEDIPFEEIREAFASPKISKEEAKLLIEGGA